MKNIIGTVEKIENGSFNLRTSNGKIIPLHEGHKIYNGESILGKDENSLIGIKLSNKETITLNGTTEQLFDNSLLNKIDNEELAFNQKVVKDVTSIETASGEDKTNVETATGNENQDSTSFKAVFDARDGNSVDIESDLREGTLNQDVNYYQYEQLDASLLNPQAELEPVTPLPVEPTPPPVPPVKPEEPEIPLNAELKAKNDTVIEGENITITVTLDNPSKNDLIITLSNDEIITIKAGETEGSVTFENPYNDDKYVQGDRNLDFSIKNVTGDNIENLPTVTITVKDDQDVTKITLTGSIVTEGEEHTITATVDNAPKSDLVITLSNGKTITILAGEFEGSVTYNSRADDVYLQGEESNSISIASTIGGDYEAIDYENSNVKVTVSDGDNSNVTTTTISITSTENINYAITDTTAELTTDRTDKPGTSYVSGNLDVLDPNEKYLDGFYAKEDGYLPVNSNETYEVNGKEYIKYKGKEYLVPSITAEDIEIKEFYIKDGLVKLDENGKAYSESILVLEHPAKYDMEFRFGSTQDIYMIKVGETTSNPIKQYAINNGADDVYTSSGGSGTHLWLSKVDGEEILLRTYENKNDVFNISEANTVLPNTVTVMFKEDSNIDTTNVNISTQIVDDNAIFTIQTSNPPKTGTIANATIQINGLIYSVTLDATGKGTLTLSIDDINNIQTGKIEATVTKCGGQFEDLTYGSTTTEVNKEVTYDIQTSNPPDPNGNWDYVTTFPTAIVEVNHNGKTDNYTVNLDRDGKGTLTLDVTDTLGKEEPTIKVSDVNGNYEDVDLNANVVENPTTYTDLNNLQIETTNLANPLSTSIDLSNLTDEVVHDGIINLKAQAFDNLMITLEDVMNLGNKNITITGADIDKLTFKDTVGEDGNINHWEAVCETNQETGMNECIYTNTGDDHLQIKVEQPISDGVTC